MLKRTWSLLLVIAMLAAPGAAFAAAPDRTAADDTPRLVEWVWSGIARLLGIGEEAPRESRRESGGPRAVTAADDAGGHFDPNG